MAEKSKFFKVYRICVISFAAVLAAGLIVLFFWLKEYQAGLPETVVDNALQALTNADGDNLTEIQGTLVSPYETPDNLSAALAEKIDGSLVKVRTTAKKDGYELSYTIKTESGKKIATLYLRKKDKKEILGNRHYIVGLCELEEDFYSTATLSMPANAEITVNGKTLNKADRVNGALPALKGAGVKESDLIKPQTAVLNNFVALPEIKAKIGGREIPVIAENGVYTISPEITEQEKKQMEKVAFECASDYALFMENDKSFKDASRHMKEGTEFYENVKTALVKWAFEHDEDIIEPISVTDYYKFSDTVYSCRAKLTQTVKVHERNRIFIENIDKTVFFVKDGGAFKVIDMQSVGE